ncbi:MAG: NAD(P)H-binding protein [Sandaracinaceae bacterium]|nr:NAD(P)H-binding protein [Sandaracinaceae bacterium]
MEREPTIWLVGATGLVGKGAVRSFIQDERPGLLRAFLRRSTGLEGARYEETIIDFEKLSEEISAKVPADESPDVALCALGTTIKVAGTKEAFRRIDHDYVLAFAEAAKSRGVRHFIAVTALNSNARSPFFYSRVKGDVERALRGMGFESLTLVRPSLLLGEREERRFAESFAAPFSKLLPRALRGIEGERVGRALIALAFEEPLPGVRIVPSGELFEIAP